MAIPSVSKDVSNAPAEVNFATIISALLPVDLASPVTIYPPSLVWFTLYAASLPFDVPSILNFPSVSKATSNSPVASVLIIHMSYPFEPNVFPAITKPLSSHKLTEYPKSFPLLDPPSNVLKNATLRFAFNFTNHTS